MDRDVALKAIKNGTIAALVSGVITVGVVLVALATDADGKFALWNDPFNFIDIIIIFACAFGLYRKSRFAACFLFVYFIFARFMIVFETGELAGAPVSLVILYFYARAIQGTFAYHRLEKAENPNYRKTPKWVWYVGTLLMVVILGLSGIGLLSSTGVLPSAHVQAGQDVSSDDRTTLVENGLIYSTEKLRYFYSSGFVSILESGAILTEDRVILYMKDDSGMPVMYQLFVDEVASVDLVHAGNRFIPSIFRVNSFTPDAWLQIPLSAVDGGDVKFMDTLRELAVAKARAQ